jgi:ABC-type dipeptide/oligopeptide/nickel transport system permease subunit
VAAVGGGGLPAYALRRLLLAIPVLFGVSLLVFAVLHLAPGDPAAIMLGAQSTKEDVERLHRDLGLDRPLVVQYFRWMGHVVQGDTLMAFPYFLLAVAIIAALGPGLVNGMVAVAVVNIPFYGRIVRATVLAVKQTEYVESARALGVSELRLALTHVLRNCLAPVIVAVTLNIGGMITALAGLSFLGLGVQPPTSDWGSMLAASRQYLNVAPHVAALPGIAIFLTVLGFNLLGDGLRDALDPRLR